MATAEGVYRLKYKDPLDNQDSCSARYIFGDSTGDPVADRMLSALQKHGEFDRTAVRDLFARNMPGTWIERALTLLTQARRITVEKITDSRGGRPRTVIRLLDSTTKTTKPQ